MLQRLVVRGSVPWRERRHAVGSGGRPVVEKGSDLRFVLPVMTVILSLLAPPTVRAQDRSQLRATATVIPAQPSSEALKAALRLSWGQPGASDSSPVSRPPLAQIRVRRPGQQGDSAIVVSIEFLHN